ncbi:MAG TPA: hypothetical protein PK995_07985 [Bacteroidia bacterium]|nr:hypothetical protein [Bacteroidia bacterium]
MKNIFKQILYLFLFFFVTCNDYQLNFEENIKTNNGVTFVEIDEKKDMPKIIDTIENTIGILKLNENYKNEMITFFNLDNSVWYRFKYCYGCDIEINDLEKKFIPYAYHIDYFIMILRVVKMDSGSFYVIVNEEQRLIKKINKNNYFTFRNWKEHILNDVSSIDFDVNKNPVMEKPEENSKRVENVDGEFYFPVEIKGEWLKINWIKGKKEYYGWIKWKNKNTLLIELYYFL